MKTLLSALTAAALLFAAPALAADERPLLNEASADQLIKLDNVDAEMADSIIEMRGRAAFSNHEALRRVPGMTEAALDSLRGGTDIEYEFPTGAGKKFTNPDAVLEEFSNEPTVQQVQSWASDYARLHQSMVQRWLAQSNSFAMLPEFRVEYRFKGNAGNDWEYYPADGDVDTPDESVFDVLDKAGRDREDRITVRAVWDLDKLIMSSERIRVINEAQDIVKLRDKVLTEVTRLYFERRRVQVDMLLSPKRDVSGQVKDQLHLMELTANVDALTGGSFSASLK